ncbi:class I SAM-dependent methyltransferase [Pseudomonas sp. PDM16]|uniref:class I SAM-dependent methyltransferase n=1 Tax=Pseudomonas sp. PDM16 TaxID=2769292 RepID=UPI001786F645|nr:class I SAM-dependent methyltransferase [Pseudomonas sp. PDM16]MBD9413825.1 class I SAM-dependent methyltransferase [Pseudomonas sp. PDM16]
MSRLRTLLEWTRSVVHVLCGGDRRRTVLLMWRRPRGLFQPYGTTQENRYPGLFRLLRQGLDDVPQTRVLSFGCSTGEEVFSLARYFQLARIHGVDVDANRIGACMRRWRREGHDPRLSFACAGDVSQEVAGSYDLVVAMSVFRHGALSRTPINCSTWIRFADFDRAIDDLARVLKPGGLLVILHSNFRFGDTGTASQFDCVRLRSVQISPIYGCDDRLIPGMPGDDGVYRKRQAPTA